MLSMKNHVLTYINLASKQILYWHNIYFITVKEILFRGVMWHTYSRCCKKPLPYGWNFTWWWSQMQDVPFTWTWWLFCTADKFRKHAGIGKLVCSMMVCFRSAWRHKYLYITDQITWLVVGGLEYRGRVVTVEAQRTSHQTFSIKKHCLINGHTR